ncbi:hypothetical protein KO561_18485 [Radiobacillus kanasensis]|uniref:hypothetical protein n=1 Tax=Radiobacillus kanasensis TaxID=2844358 RepID=UPI001E3F82EB|nr:hypothetical protein [Radiobacillus kanasensis]UFT99140.1 hypothetical protein KO561_18485 [Radiobacillus kanasensis]
MKKLLLATLSAVFVLSFSYGVVVGTLTTKTEESYILANNEEPDPLGNVEEIMKELVDDLVDLRNLI